MEWRKILARLTLVAVAATVACGDESSSPSGSGEAILEVVAGNSQAAVAGATVAVAPTVRAVNARGRAIEGAEVTFVVTRGGGTVSGSTQLTNSEGLATVGSWTLGPVAGANELVASAAGFRSAVVQVSSTAAGARTLALASPSSLSGAAGAPLSTPVQVAVTDAFGNSVPGATVSFSVTSGGGSISGGTAVTGSSGIATLGSWTLGQTAGANTLSAASTGATPLTITATGTAGTAASISIAAGNGLNSTAGLLVPVPPTVVARDAFGNVVQGTPVTFSVVSGGGSLSAPFAVTGANGQAAAGSWRLGSALGSNTVRATAPGLEPVTFTATAIAGIAATIEIVAGNQQQATVGTGVAVAPRVRIRDISGNPIAGMSVGFQITAGGGQVAAGSAMTNTQGEAAPASWTLGTTAGVNTLSASVSGLPAVVFTATGRAGGITQLVKLAGDNLIEPVGTGVVYPTVRAVDAFGNPVPGAVITFLVLSGGGTASGATPITDSNGVVNVGMWTLGTIAGTNTLSASAPGAAPVVFTAMGVAGPPARLVKIAGDGQSAVVGQPLAIAPVVAVTDAYGNPVAGVPITFAITGGGSITSATSITGMDGRASSGTWTMGTTPGAATLTASASFPGTGLVSVTFNASATSAGAASIAIIGGNNQIALVGTAVPVSPSVRVLDQYGNPVAGAVVTFTVLSGGGTVSSAFAVTNASGIATLATWTLGPITGANTLRAATGALPPVVFSASGAGPLVAVGGLAAGGTIRTSLDGLTWVEQASPFTELGRSVAYGGNGLWLAGGQGGAVTLARSVNTTTWLPVTTPLTVTVAGLAWNGSMWVSGGSDGVSTTIATSPDGTTWTAQASPFDDPFSFVSSIAWNGSYWVAGGSAIGGDPGFATSPDGIVWTPRSSPFTFGVTNLAWNGSLFVATGSGGASLATSPDGITWTPRATSFTTFGAAVAWNGSMWLAVGGGDPASAVHTSADGITWTPRVSPFTEALSVTWTGTHWVALGRDAGLVPISAISTDGISWTSAPIGFSALASAAAWGGVLLPPLP